MTLFSCRYKTKFSKKEKNVNESIFVVVMKTESVKNRIVSREKHKSKKLFFGNNLL